MPNSNFNLRNLSPQVMASLKKEAKRQNSSINSLILVIIERGLGIVNPTEKTVFHDLDYLAGSWSDKDKKAFDENIKSFEQIDKEFW